MKDPVGIFGWRRGFSVARYARLCRSPERITPCGILYPEGGSLMPPWMEILINVIGYAGFIGIAKYHKPSDENRETMTHH